MGFTASVGSPLGTEIEAAEIADGTITDVKMANTYGVVTTISAQHRWEFNNDATDDVGSADLTPEASVTYDATNKKFGSHAYLNADAGAAKAHTHPTLLDTIKTDYTNGITFCAFIRPTGTGGTYYFFGKANDATNDHMGMNIATTDKLTAYMKVGGTLVSLIPNKVLSANTWYFVAFVIKANGDIYAYVIETDGTTTSASDTSTFSAMLADGTANDFTIGAKWGSTDDFKGQIDCFEIYDSALTQAQLVTLAARSAAAITLQSLDDERSVT